MPAKYLIESKANRSCSLFSIQRQIEELQERQRRIGKLLSERKISIGVLPSPDNDELEQTLHKSTKSAEHTLNKLQQHHRSVYHLNTCPIIFVGFIFLVR